VAENTLRRFARLFAGVVLSQGHLGHEVLGQLLIFDATEVEVAGANLAMAATTRQRSAFAQVAIRTAVPALAVQALLSKREKQLAARERRLVARGERGSEVDPTRQTRRQRPPRRGDGAARLAALEAELQSSRADAEAKLAALEAENHKLREDLAAQRTEPSTSAESPPTPPITEGRSS